jgi:protein TonB
MSWNLPSSSGKKLPLYAGSLAAILLLVCIQYAVAQDAASHDPIPIGKGVTPPVPVYRPEPAFPPQARRAHVQGSVLLGIVIGPDGRTRSVEVISPAGFGLDEAAVAAVEKWQFRPAEKDGRPVAVTANVEVNFRFPGEYFNEKDERRRTAFNRAVTALSRNSGPEAVKRARESLQKLAQEKYPPAQQAVGSWYLHGAQDLEKDPPRGIAMLEAAAKHDDANAIFELGRLKLTGVSASRKLADEEGLRMIHEASVLGSVLAQVFLAEAYYNGERVEKDHARAKRYLRLCGARGISGCQSMLGRMLLASAVERERLQGLAWLHLAAEGGDKLAIGLLPQESAKLTEEQKNWVTKLKPQLLRRAE